MSGLSVQCTPCRWGCVWLEVIRLQGGAYPHLHLCRINNAGSNAYKYKPLAESTDADLIRIVETNVLGVMLGCKEVQAMHSFPSLPTSLTTPAFSGILSSSSHVRSARCLVGITVIQDGGIRLFLCSPCCMEDTGEPFCGSSDVCLCVHGHLVNLLSVKCTGIHMYGTMAGVYWAGHQGDEGAERRGAHLQHGWRGRGWGGPPPALPLMAPPSAAWPSSANPCRCAAVSSGWNGGVQCM